jgi:hypothetical protein
MTEVIGEYVEFIYCACDCGFTKTKYDKRKRIFPFILHHNAKGTKSKCYKGRAKRGSYYAIKSYGHPHADAQGYVMEHRLVWEEYYNCCLLPWVDIHHINLNKYDNRLINLQPLFHWDHTSFHNDMDKLKKRLAIQSA